MLVHAAGGQAHGQADALLNDGALQEDVLAQLAFLTGDDGVRDLTHQVVGGFALDVGVGHPCNLGKHLAANLDDRRVDSSKTHSNLSLFYIQQITDPFRGWRSDAPRLSGTEAGHKNDRHSGTEKTACLRVRWYARRCNRQAAPEYPLLL